MVTHENRIEFGWKFSAEIFFVNFLKSYWIFYRINNFQERIKLKNIFPFLDIKNKTFIIFSVNF